VVAVPEDKPKSVSSDVKKETEKKEVSGMYHSVEDLDVLTRQRGLSDGKIAWFLTVF
jgi:hypothetical protein